MGSTRDWIGYDAFWTAVAVTQRLAEARANRAPQCWAWCSRRIGSVQNRRQRGWRYESVLRGLLGSHGYRTRSSRRVGDRPRVIKRHKIGEF